MFVSTDRWTCPTCNRTVVVDGSKADTDAAIHAVQLRHGEGHRAAALVLDHVGLAGVTERAAPRARRPRRPRRRRASTP